MKKFTNDSTEIRKKAVESFTDQVYVEKLVIVQLEYSDMRLTEEIDQSIKREIGWNVPIEVIPSR